MISLKRAATTAEVVLTDLLRNAAGAENALHLRVIHLGAGANPAVQPEFEAAVEHEAGLARIDVLAGIREVRRLRVAVRDDTGRHVGPGVLP
jgi:hypothetical protein